MAKLILLNTRLFVAGADLQAHTNRVELDGEREVKDTTNFGSAGWRESIAGLGSSMFKGEGQFEAADLSEPDNAGWASMGAVVPVSCAPDAATVGSLAYLVSGLESKHAVLTGNVGDVAGYSIEGVGSSPLVRGRVAQQPGAAMSSSSQAAGYELGAVATGKTLYANLHVYSVSGSSTPTLNLLIESDDNSNFTSATTRITFAGQTAIGGQSMSVAGPITDTWYRARWTVSGTTPSFLGFVTFGIA